MEKVSVRMLSEIEKIPEKTIRDWILKKKIPYYKEGPSKRLVRIDLEEFRNLHTMRVEPLTTEIIRAKIA